MPLLAVALLPHLDQFVGGAGVNVAIDGRHDGVYRVVVGVLHRLDALEIGAPPYLHAPVPRNGVEQSAVGRHGERRDGVDVVDPRAFLVAADFDVVLGREEPHAAVVDSRKGCDELDFLDINGVFAPPHADSVIAVRRDELIAENDDGFDGGVAL